MCAVVLIHESLIWYWCTFFWIEVHVFNFRYHWLFLSNYCPVTPAGTRAAFVEERTVAHRVPAATERRPTRRGTRCVCSLAGWRIIMRVCVFQLFGQPTQIPPYLFFYLSPFLNFPIIQAKQIMKTTITATISTATTWATVGCVETETKRYAHYIFTQYWKVWGVLRYPYHIDLPSSNKTHYPIFSHIFMYIIVILYAYRYLWVQAWARWMCRWTSSISAWSGTKNPLFG